MQDQPKISIHYRNIDELRRLNNNFKGTNVLRVEGKTTYLGTARGWEVKIDTADFQKVKYYAWVGFENHSDGSRKSPQRYAYTKIDGRTVTLHRFLMDAKKGQVIDHINGDGLDNRLCNLRFVTISQNNLNRHFTVRKDRNLPIGVSRNPSGGKFFSMIQHRYLGTFDTIEEASQAYRVEKEKVMTL